MQSFALESDADKSRLVKQSRARIAALLGANDNDEIGFTNGVTDAHRQAIRSALMQRPQQKRIVTTAVEHRFVNELCQELACENYEIARLGVDEYGRLDLENLRRSITPQTALVVASHANQETGVIFPVGEIAALVKQLSTAAVHVDGTFAVGKIAINLRETLIDSYAVAGDKFHAPAQIGALYRRGLRHDLQRRKQRAETVDSNLIIGLGAASELVKNLDWTANAARLRDRLENEILENIPNSRRNGAADERLPNTSNISFDGIEAESVAAHLQANNIIVAVNSACSSATRESSATLRAMNVPYKSAMGAIGFSLSRETTARQIETTLEILPAIVEKLRCISPLL